jgi:hypothetical protein
VRSRLAGVFSSVFEREIDYVEVLTTTFRCDDTVSGIELLE